MNNPLTLWRRSRRRRLPGGSLWLQVIRRSVQLSVIAGLVAIPVLSLYVNLSNQRDVRRIKGRWDTRAVYTAVSGMEDPSIITQSVRGSVWTLKVGDLVISDPLAVVDFAAAAGTLFDAFILTLLIPLLITLVLGRVFCGWICPADLLFEVGSWVRRWVGIERDVSFSRKLKFALLIFGAAAATVLGVQVFAEIYPPRIISGELYLWITFGALSAGSWFMLLLVAFELFVSERFWCRYACPGGALYAWLGAFRIVRLKVDRTACTDCDKCLPLCEFGLDPMNGNFGAECNNCGLCVRGCGPKALVWRIGRRPPSGLDIINPDTPVAPEKAG